VLGLKKQRDELRRAQIRADAEEKKMKGKAKECLSKGQKDKALKILRRKKAIDKRLETTDSHLENIQTMIDQIQTTKEQQKIVSAMATGNKALKELHTVLNPEYVERVMDEVTEGVENQQEIDALISRTVFNSADEEDLEAELEALTSVNLPAVPKTEIDLPNVPVSENESEKATSVEQEPVLA